MKTLIVLIGMLISISACSQKTTVPLALRMDLVTWVKLEPKDYLAGGKVGILSIKVRNYDVYKDTKGQWYINTTNSSLKTAPVTLGYAFGTHEYEGNTVFFNTDTTRAWIWTVDKFGLIIKMDLPSYFAKDARIKK